MQKIFTVSLTAAFILFLGALVAYGGWTDPTQTPPGGNVAAPLNVGSIGQAKAGGLHLNIGHATLGLRVEEDAEIGRDLLVGRELEVTGLVLPIRFIGSTNQFSPPALECQDASHVGRFLAGRNGDLWVCGPGGWQLNSASKKLCRVINTATGGPFNSIGDGHILPVPNSWTPDNCKGYAALYSDAQRYQLGCLLSDRVAFGVPNFITGNVTAPSPNCGW